MWKTFCHERRSLAQTSFFFLINKGRLCADARCPKRGTTGAGIVEREGKEKMEYWTVVRSKQTFAPQSESTIINTWYLCNYCIPSPNTQTSLGETATPCTSLCRTLKRLHYLPTSTQPLPACNKTWYSREPKTHTHGEWDSESCYLSPPFPSWLWSMRVRILVDAVF